MRGGKEKGPIKAKDQGQLGTVEAETGEGNMENWGVGIGNWGLVVLMKRVKALKA